MSVDGEGGVNVVWLALPSSVPAKSGNRLWLMPTGEQVTGTTTTGSESNARPICID